MDHFKGVRPQIVSPLKSLQSPTVMNKRVSRSRFLGQPKLEFPPVLAYDAGSVDKPFANESGASYQRPL
jgi:hypothetical protein